MSQENVELARRVFDAWNAGDVDALTEMVDPEVEFVPFRSQLEGVSYRGPQGIRQFARDAAGEWDYLRVAPTEYRDVGGDRVLVLGHMEGRGLASGMDLRVPAAWLLHVRRRKLTALRAYSKQEDALDAAGLGD